MLCLFAKCHDMEWHMIINVILNRSCSTGKEWNIEALSCIYTIRQRFEMWFKMGSVRSYRCRSEKNKGLKFTWKLRFSPFLCGVSPIKYRFAWLKSSVIYELLLICLRMFCFCYRSAMYQRARCVVGIRQKMLGKVGFGQLILVSATTGVRTGYWLTSRSMISQ